jgi:hypothetical protein
MRVLSEYQHANIYPRKGLESPKPRLDKRIGVNGQAVVRGLADADELEEQVPLQILVRPTAALSFGRVVSNDASGLVRPTESPGEARRSALFLEEHFHRYE